MRTLVVLLFAVTIGVCALAGSVRPAAAQTTYSITLTASAASLPVGTAVTLSASATGDLSKLSYGAMEIHRGTDIYTGTGDGVCGADAPNSSCTGQWTAKTPGTSQFIAQVWSMGSGSVVAKSNIVSVTWTAVATPTATASPTRTPAPTSAPTMTTPTDAATTDSTVGTPESDSGGIPWGPAAAIVGGATIIGGGGILLRRRRVPTFPGATGSATWPPIIDADGNPLPTQDGTYGGGGAPGDVWYGGRWVPRDVAERGIIDDRHALDDRRREATEFTTGTDTEREHWLHDRDVEREVGGGQTPPADSNGPVVTPEQIGDLTDRFNLEVNSMIHDGYTVKNRNPLFAAGNTIRDAESALVKYWGGYGIDDPRAGRCGEYGQWGIDRSKEFVHDIFGKDAITDDIVIQKNSAPGSLDEQIDAIRGAPPPAISERTYFFNHRATRVVLPNGDRYVLDYWDGVATGQPAMIPEQQWIEKFKPGLGGDFRVDRSIDESHIKQVMERIGTNIGGKTYSQDQALQALRSEHIPETLLRSWQKAPW